jgi:hypothetical protein
MFNRATARQSRSMRAALLLLALAACGGSDLPRPDLAGVDLLATEGGALPFGAACTVDGDCATGTCFHGGMGSFCTMPCTSATQAKDCPAPPTSGTCNMKGYCKP